MFKPIRVRGEFEFAELEGTVNIRLGGYVVRLWVTEKSLAEVDTARGAWLTAEACDLTSRADRGYISGPELLEELGQLDGIAAVEVQRRPVEVTGLDYTAQVTRGMVGYRVWP